MDSDDVRLCCIYYVTHHTVFIYRYEDNHYIYSIVYDKIGVNNENFYSGLHNVDSGCDKVRSAVFVVSAECYEALGGG